MFSSGEIVYMINLINHFLSNLCIIYNTKHKEVLLCVVLVAVASAEVIVIVVADAVDAVADVVDVVAVDVVADAADSKRFKYHAH